MHIALVSPAWPPSESANGIVTYVAMMREALIGLGHRVTVFTSDDGQVDPPSAGVQRVKVRHPGRLRGAAERLLGMPASGIVRFGERIANAMLELHRHDRIDVAEMEEGFGWFRDVAKRVPFPVVVKLHGPAFRHIIPEERHTSFSRAKIRREGAALKQQSVVLSPSACTLTDTCRHYGLKPVLAEVVPNPIDTARLPVWSLDQADRNQVLFVGRFDNVKGADRVLDMFKALKERVSSARLIMAGPDYGFIGSDGVRLKYADYVRRHLPCNVIQDIDFLGRVPPDKVLELRRAARVTVFASRMENLPYAVVEALGQGCPVAAMRCDGVDELVMRQQTGLLSSDVSQFVDDVAQLLLDDALSSRLSSDARRFIEQRCSPGIIATQTLTAYASAIASAGRRKGLPALS